MDNDVTCKVVDIGIVKIKMWDGVTLTLRDVRHVPALKKNLISLGKLDANRCVIQTDDRAIKVKKGSMVILQHKATEQSIQVEKKYGNRWSGNLHGSKR